MEVKRMTEFELDQLLEKFEDHYDELDKKAWQKGNKRSGEYACRMLCACRSIRKRIHRVFIEIGKRTIDENDMMKIMSDRKAESRKRMEEAQRSGDEWAATNCQAIIRSFDILEKRLQTAFGKKARKAKP
jgi:hypothetical protein